MEKENLPKLRLVSEQPEAEPWKWWGMVELLRAEMLRALEKRKAIKHIFPIINERLKLVLRTGNTNYVSAVEMVFSTVESSRFFLESLKSRVDQIETRNPTAAISIDVWLFPFEIGGKRLINRFILKKALPAPAKKTERLAEVTLPAEVIAISETRDSVAETVAESDNNSQPTIPEQKPANMNIDAEKAWAESQILYDYRAWRLYPTSQSIRRIKKVLDAKNIHTPADLAGFLGTTEPTVEEWYDFIGRLNGDLPQPNRIGNNTVDDLLKWMRRNRLIAEQFRER